jgi:excisionase family DNA binding protein
MSISELPAGAQPALLDLNQAAFYLHTSTRHLRELIARKEIACTRIGRKLRFTVAALDQYIETRTQIAQAVTYDRRK